MATLDYTSARITATRLITKFGETSTLTLPGTNGGYDEFGNVIAATPDVEVTGTVTPLLDYKKDEIDGETIRREDAYVFFDTDGEPQIGMNITINSVKYTVMNVKKLQSVGGVNVYFKLQLRR